MAGAPIFATVSGVLDDFVIARNPDGDSTLPYLVPYGCHGNFTAT